MEKRALLALFDREQRVEVTYPDCIREAMPNLVRQLPKNPDDGGYVIYSHLDEDTVEDAIRDQLAYFKARGLRF